MHKIGKLDWGGGLLNYFFQNTLFINIPIWKSDKNNKINIEINTQLYDCIDRWRIQVLTPPLHLILPLIVVEVRL